MIGVLTHHWAKADKVSEARKLLDRNGEAQSKAPGFRQSPDAGLAQRPHQNYYPGGLDDE